MARRTRKGKQGKWLGRFLTAVLAGPALYLAAALAGSLIPANRNWTESRRGTTIYLADNGIHTDVMMPLKAQGLDWSELLPRSQFAAVPAEAGWIAFGSGEREVYLDTPTWPSIRAHTIVAAVLGGPRVMHVEYVQSPAYAVREIRLRREEYRRLWTAIRADFALDTSGKPQRIRHDGYGPADAFYKATGKASAFSSCNTVVARWLRLAGVKTSLWPPFAPGLLWRYRRTQG